MFDAERIRARIEHAALTAMELPLEAARDVAFHMTDWLDDLHRYAAFCRNPDSFGAEQVDELLLAFLGHVPNHIAAAAKLYADLPVSDIFSVGATCAGPRSD